ncbi:hypothetical protein WDW86_16505 [Bdellovibrionota bacterium FG-2]
MAKKESQEEGGLNFLSVGTRLLTKDVMDQYIRTMGPHRTYYATGMVAAQRVIADTIPDIILMEYEYADGTAFRLLQEIKKLPASANVFTILAVDEDSLALKNIAEEMHVDAILMKPFSAKNIEEQFLACQKRADDKTSVSSLVRQAERAFDEKAFTFADKLFRLAIQTGGENARILSKAGAYYAKVPDYTQAEKHLERAVKIDPQCVVALNELGLLYLKKKEFRQAFDYLTRAQDLSPLNPERPKVMMKLHMMWATETMKSVLMTDPGNDVLKYELAKLSIFQKDYAGAMKLFQQVKFETADPRHDEMQKYTTFLTKLSALR